MKHTPGPWRIIDHDEEYITITDAEQDFGVCKLEESASENREIMKANACLIAVAPEMLNLLIRLEKSLERDANAGGTYDSFTVASGFIVEIHKMILKSRGEK